MMSGSIISRFLRILAIFSLAVAPVATPAMALSQAHMVMVNDVAMAMPDDMPCCPKKAAIPDCSKDCLAICASQLFYNISPAALVVPLGLADLLLPANEPGLVGLNQRPPPRPPKI
jgi:hypothetical protein